MVSKDVTELEVGEIGIKALVVDGLVDVVVKKEVGTLVSVIKPVGNGVS